MFPLLLLPFIFSLSYSCPNGTFSSSLNTSICYTVLEGAAGKHSWYDGEALCQVQFNGHLASVPNAFLNNFLNGYLDATQSKTHYWIGGTTTTASNASWTWTDGTPFTYTNWEFGDPGTGPYYCTYLEVPEALWGSPYCSYSSSSYAFLCEFLNTNN
uniref:C-type lectin domain-containing protein n=1 Tax=Acrobeloides nanus TaxID=290746 RepID=A0A914CGA4_9BILA